MGLYVSTTVADVSIPELGFTLYHTTTDYGLSEQFSPEDLQRAESLTSAIRTGLLVWRKTAGGPAQVGTDYDPDFVESEDMNTGLGAKGDRLVSFKDLNVMTLPTKSGKIAGTSFTGTPKKYTVTFSSPFADSNYSVKIGGNDSRVWSIENQATTGFVINTNANQALTGSVYWDAIYAGETV